MDLLHNIKCSIRALLYLVSYTLPSAISISILFFILQFSDQGKDILVNILERDQSFDRFLFFLSLTIFSLCNWFYTKQSFFQNFKRKIPLYPEKESDISYLRVYSAKDRNAPIIKNIGEYYKLLPRFYAFITIYISGISIVSIGKFKSVWGSNLMFLILVIFFFSYLGYLKTISHRIIEFHKKNVLVSRQTLLIAAVSAIILLTVDVKTENVIFTQSFGILFLSFSVFYFLTIRTQKSLFPLATNKNVPTSFRFIYNGFLKIISREKSNAKFGFKRFAFYDLVNVMIWVFVIIHIFNNFIFELPQKLGPVLTFLFALTTIVTLLGITSNIVRNNGFSLTTFFSLFIFVWISFSWFFGGKSSHYKISTIKSEIHPGKRDSLDHYIKKWLINKYEVRKDFSPIFLISSSGGGIRASYWTNLVLAQIMDSKGKSFYNNILSMSGSSGGTIGLGVFHAIGVNHQKTYSEDIFDYYKKRDFLSNNIAKLFGIDILGNFFGIGAMNRHQALELEFSKQLEKLRVNTNINKGFLNYWYAEGSNNPELKPLFFPTSTNVTLGKIALYSPCHLNQFYSNTFYDIYDKKEHYFRNGSFSYLDVPFITAICQSARFPFVSPAGHFDKRDQFMDAGYLDNIGGEVTLMVLDRTKKILKSLEKEKPNIYKYSKISVLLLKNTPDCTNKDEIKTNSFGVFLPISSLYSSWEGSTESVEDRLKKVAIDESEDINIISCELELNPVKDNSELEYIFPLGWYLSKESLNAMYAKSKQIDFQKIY
jgi:hypothetical protein